MSRLAKFKQAKAKALDHTHTGRVTWTESLTFDLRIDEQVQASEAILTRKSQRGVSAISFIADAILLLDELEQGETTRLMKRFRGLIGTPVGYAPAMPALPTQPISTPSYDDESTYQLPPVAVELDSLDDLDEIQEW